MKYQEIISHMKLGEKAELMSGKDTWRTKGFSEYGIPELFLSDGPHGLRKQAGASDHLGLNASIPATCFPTAATVANSWDEDLGEKIGEYLGEEAQALGVHIILGPGLNVKRNPLCGRNFEYFSEDPYLSGKMAAAYIRGIQKKGVGACPKHFAVNSQELRRMSNNSVVDERTLREIYLTGFEIAVKEGKPKAIMTSYNRINGVYANENPYLLQDILKKDWGFDGIVMSDWGGSNDHVEGVQSGSHLEMPSTGKMGACQIERAVKKKHLDENILDERVGEFLKTVFQISGEWKKTEMFDVEEHHQFARKAASESVVLLKNEDKLLPLRHGEKVAVIGEFADIPRYQGAGSSLVNTTMLDTILNSIEKSGLDLAAYAPGYTRKGNENGNLIKNAVKMAQNAGVVLVFAGLDENSESEGLDREHMRIPQKHTELIHAVSEVNENVIVALSAGAVVEMPWEDKVKAIVHGYLGGQAGASAMLDVLTGVVNPGGRLSESYPFFYEDVPSRRYYPGKEKTSEYREGLYVGYRYYDTVEKGVRYPFGYGLSYTTFAYADLEIKETGVSLVITNTGNQDGSDVVQMYIGLPGGEVFRPKKELKGFRKVFLKAGERRKIEIPFDDKAFRFLIHLLESGKQKQESI